MVRVARVARGGGASGARSACLGRAQRAQLAPREAAQRAEHVPREDRAEALRARLEQEGEQHQRGDADEQHYDVGDEVRRPADPQRHAAVEDARDQHVALRVG